LALMPTLDVAYALPGLIVGQVTAAMMAVRRFGLRSRVVIGGLTIAALGIVVVGGFLMVTAPTVRGCCHGVAPL
jgi:hypothetical protein